MTRRAAKAAGASPSPRWRPEPGTEKRWLREAAGALDVGVLTLTAGRPLADLTGAEAAEAIPPWFAPEMIAGAGRARLGEWSRAGSPVPSPVDLVRRLRFVGDPEVRDVVLISLHERIPAPASAFLLDNVLFVAVGHSAAGWMIRLATPAGPCLTLVLLSGGSHDGTAILDVVLHESAHAWTLPEPATLIRAEDLHNEADASLVSAAKRPELLAEVLRHHARVENFADELAKRWGGRLTCSAVLENAYTLARARQLAASVAAARVPAPKAKRRKARRPR